MQDLHLQSALHGEDALRKLLFHRAKRLGGQEFHLPSEQGALGFCWAKGLGGMEFIGQVGGVG
jgi:hypothetical protein